ncbi:MAG: hypothetical protein H6Q89_3909 [Myxococcaceae bacterium]|nr:hypothetical protein [Myxococcaceae bacterium]
MLAIRPALSNWLDAVRRAATSAPVAEPRVKRFEQPVPKVVRLPRHRDSFEGAESSYGLKQPASRSATPAPKPGATDVTRFLHRDGFESAARKPVELAPKPPPSFRAGVAVFRFR